MVAFGLQRLMQDAPVPVEADCDGPLWVEADALRLKQAGLSV